MLVLALVILRGHVSVGLGNIEGDMLVLALVILRGTC